ncbi:MAG TPA: hypothetical protein VFC82_04455 [Actinomycetaceae bacterium]|nr:hypothetical protein [Actinomycetaceae bacterium]
MRRGQYGAPLEDPANKYSPTYHYGVARPSRRQDALPTSPRKEPTSRSAPALARWAGADVQTVRPGSGTSGGAGASGGSGAYGGSGFNPPAQLPRDVEDWVTHSRQELNRLKAELEDQRQRQRQRQRRR